MLSADLVNKGNEPVAFPIAFLPRRHTPLTAGAIQFRTRNTSGVTRTDQNRARDLRNRFTLESSSKLDRRRRSWAPQPGELSFRVTVELGKEAR
jgi:hypothetical protein